MRIIKKDLMRKKIHEGQSDFDIQVERFKRRDKFMDYYLPRISLAISIISLILAVILLVL